MKIKKVTLTQVAALAGVSKATVSRVLNGKVAVSKDIQRRVEDAVEKTGYQKKNPGIQIGVDVDKITLISGDYLGSSHSFYNSILDGLRDEAKCYSLELEIVLVKKSSLIEFIESKIKAAKAIILIGIDSRPILDLILKHKVPSVILNGIDTSMQISSVTPDYMLGGLLATNELLSQGHRKIKLITATHRHSLNQRTEGFRQALELSGIEFNKETHVLDLISYAKEHSSDQTLAQRICDGQADMDFGASEILPIAVNNGEFDDCTAIFCVCDMVAYSLFDVLSEQNINVGEDISVIGFDNLDLSAFSNPPLTSINTDFSELARASLYLLIQEIAQPHHFTKRLSVGVELVKRKSVISI